MKKKLLKTQFKSLPNLKKWLLALSLLCLISIYQDAYSQTTINYSGSIVYYKVPTGVTSIRIQAWGAEGGLDNSSSGSPGKGAAIKGTINVTPGQRLKILVGERPGRNGGGGGTFITDTLNNPLIVAGGGAGSSSHTGSSNKDGQITTSGGNGVGGGGNGGTSGSGGSVGSGAFQSGAGGGFYSNGADGSVTNAGGQSFLNGGSGGSTAFTNGGFGGGGSGSGYVIGGGGGGYSGGGGGSNQSSGTGGGGGSYNGGSNQDDTAGVRSGHGLVIITNACNSANVSSISVSPNSETNTGGVNTNLYIGYPTNNPSVTLTANTSGTVTWSPATYLSCSTCTTTVFSPIAAGNYTFTAANCGGSNQSVTICVKDIRVPNTSGTRAAVYICHKEPTTNSTKTLAVLLRGIPSHLQYHSGDKLGVCGNTCATSKRDFDYENLVIDEQSLEVMCSPNPFRQSFKLHYISNSTEKAVVSIYGMTGNLVETITLEGVADEAELGTHLPNGIYTVSFIQGDKNRVFRMIKVD